MARTFEFESFEGGRRTGAPHCMACEEMLADALDENLGESAQTWFDGHVQTCAECSAMLADARRGAAWLEMLRTPRPDPSARLMERILAQTSGMANGLAAGETLHQPQMVPGASPATLPEVTPINVLAFRPRGSGFRSSPGAMFEPRLAMTAAMAFFSIALTLNLTGVQLNRLHVGALKPSSLKHTYYAANAEAARYYDNLRVVRVMESRVDDLKAASADVLGGRDGKEQRESSPGAKPENPERKPEDRKRPEGGVSRREAPIDTMRRSGEPVGA